MRRMRWLLVPLLIVGILINGIRADGPPKVPEHNRANLRKTPAVPSGTLFRHTDAAEAAAADAYILSQGVPPEKMRYYRYLSVHNLPPEMRSEATRLSFLVTNSLSRSPDLFFPAVGGPENIIIRVDLFALGIDPKVWDKFGEKDPYFHRALLKQKIVTKKTGEYEWIWEEKPRADGYRYKAQREKTITEKGEPFKEIGSAPWCNPVAMTMLIDKLQSTSPILRADWFMTFATQAPDYYDFLGFKSLKEYLDFVGFDEKRAKIKEARATVVLSGDGGLCPRVAQNNRILERVPTLWGYCWNTYDFKTSVGPNNVINNFLNENRDAGEYIGTGPNGLQYYFLVAKNDAGKEVRVNEGAIQVVVDSMSLDSRVISGRSCIWCHSNGINAFKSNFQLQIGKKPTQSDLGVFDNDPKKAMLLQDRIERLLGRPDWNEIVKSDQAIYQRTVKTLTGWDSDDMAAHFKRHWDRYFFDRLDMNAITYELGYTELEIKAMLGLRLDGKNDGALIQQLLEPPISIRRDHWEESFANIGLVSIVLPDKRNKPQGKMDPGAQKSKEGQK